jgi:hypothetical protein
MNAPVLLSDPGAILGKTFVKIGQVILSLLLLGCVYMAYLASEGFFTGWDLEFDADVASIFRGQDPDTVLLYFFVALAFKVLVLLGLLFWLGRKI